MRKKGKRQVPREEETALRERLIRAGIEEIGAHGIADFSLRRVAAACQVSCAAPYRHFKDKESFIRETVAYINSQWGLLRDNILRLYADDPARRICELCIVYIRFLLANDNYRTVLHASGDGLENALLDAGIGHAADENERTKRLYPLRALIYGTVTMLENGELENNDATFTMVRKALTDITPPLDPIHHKKEQTHEQF